MASGDNRLSGSKLKDILLGVAKAVGIDPVTIERDVQAVMRAPVKYLPVRHHSPASAYLVKQCIATWKPKLVLIEGPTSADPLIPFMVAKDTTPPFAILSMFTDDVNFFKLNGVAPFSVDPSIPAKFQVHYPFISYSPELIALHESVKRHIPVHFIDLPLTGIIPFMVNFEDQLAHFLKHEEETISTSTFYKQLVDIFHFEDFNEVWDTLFEIGAQNLSIDENRENMLYFCDCVRQTIDAKTFDLDGTFAREQYMKDTIEKHVKAYGLAQKDVLVITGGMHSITLHGTIAKSQVLPTKGFLNSLVPYSYFRISDKSGYGSGNQGPLYYERAWEKIDSNVDKPYETITLDFITDILGDARGKEQTVSVSDSINAYQEPCMKDMVDAIYMTIVKGNPAVEGAYLQPIIRDRVVGHKVGRITKSMGRLPLQDDFYLRFEALGIELSEKPEMFNLNLRNLPDVTRSVIFWRITYLGLEILDRTSGPDILKGQTGIFTETWALHWNPGVDVKLIELNIHGSTVEEASRNMLLEELKKQLKNFERVTDLLFHSIVMGFSADFDKIHQACMDSLDHDDNFLNLSAGFMNTVMIYHLLKTMLNQDKNLKLAEKMLSRNYFAACFALPNYANPKDEMIDPIVTAIKKMATTLITFTGYDFDLSAFTGSLKSCITATSNEFIKGCCVGILYLMNEIDIVEVKRQVMEYMKSDDTIKVKVGEFVRGIIFECQSQILFNLDIIKLLDDLVSAMEWPVFSAILPSLKKSFSTLQPREYEVFAEKLAEFYGLKATIVKELGDEVQERHAALFGEINKKVHDIFEEWFGAG
jgi:hypothetical protein